MPVAIQEADIYLGQGDLEPAAQITLFYLSGLPLDLSSARQVQFRAKHQTRSKLIAGTCVIVQPTLLAGVPTGRVDWVPSAGDSDVAGWYDCRCVVIWNDGRQQSVPNYTYRRLYISPAL